MDSNVTPTAVNKQPRTIAKSPPSFFTSRNCPSLARATMINLTLQVMRAFHHRRVPVLFGQAAGSHPHATIVLSRANDGNRSLVIHDFSFDSIAPRAIGQRC
ncbi:hypothetical protein [Bradyrhizobium sp. CCBAU 53421]|uniref:hypothetical protein n=1 Tax=Bradyrhizobium sp. CCBAU 53421 TaxID=1325120 RepID=UPI00188B6B80|nr:hypothetical protein [Bradyrhizobium sp. CCBAU 53421]